MSNDISRRARLMAGSAASVVSLIVFAGPVQAQETPPEEATEVEEVVITGIRSSIESSIATKRNETSIVEVVTAEDIGKLPDVSIAESLARLPGLATQRLDGRAQVISIRGLAPDFTTSLLNGREQVSTGDNRGVEFDQYPSELLGSVLVYKTPDAGLVGQGLAGTADLRTIRPLDYGRQALALNARYEWNDYGALNAGTEDTGQRYSISYIDQFMDGRLGIVLGYSHMSTPYQAERFNAWGYPGDNAVAAPNLVIGGAKPYVQSSELQRDGWLATVEFAPNASYRTSLDVFYSEFDNLQILRGIEFPLAWGGSAGACPGAPDVCRPAPALQPGFTVEDGIVTAGTFENVKGIVRNDGNRRTAELFSIGWNNSWDFGDGWSAELDLSHSRAERTDVVLETYAGTGRNVLGELDTLDFVTTPEGTTFSSSIDYSDPTRIFLTSAQGWGDGAEAPGGQDGFLNSPTTEDELSSAHVFVARELTSGPFRGFRAGVNFTERDKELTLERYYLQLVANANDPTHTTSVPIPSEFLLAPTALDYLGIPAMVSYDPFALVNSGIYNLNAARDDNLLAFGWSVSEQVLTGYIRGDLDTTFMGVPLTGNLGLQVVDVDQSSDGIIAAGNPAVPEPTTGGDSYTHLLPSANLVFEVQDNLYIRLAAARQMARPRMDQMRASVNIDYNEANAGNTSVTNGPWGGSGGNPELRPWLATAIDLSIERYFGGRGYVSLAGFYKDLESYVYDQQEIRDFSSYPVPSGPPPAIYEGIISTPQNGEGGTISGVEFALSVPFDLLHPVMDGFGAVISASYTDSDITPNPGAPSQPLPGLSETVANATLYYERNGFQARISNRYRSEFLGEISGVGTDRIQRMVAAESVVDAQIGYEFQSGALEGLSALFQVSNLTDEPFKTFENDDERRVIDHQRYGRSFLVGLNYRF